MADWVHSRERWHYSDDVGYEVALCGKRTSEYDPAKAVDDFIGEPQDNDCVECRRRLEERGQCADYAKLTSA